MSSPIVARATELSDLSALVAGGLDAVVLEGDPGIGKSCLLADVSERARAAGMLVLAAGSDEFEGARRLALLAGLLSGIDRNGIVAIGAHARLDASIQPGDAPVWPAPRVADPVPIIVDAVVDLLDRAATEHGTLLVVDDAQWADATSLRVVRGIARRAPSIGVSIAIACRRTPRSPALAQLLAGMSSLRVANHELAELSEEDALLLLESRLEGRVPEALELAAHKSGGNPFLLVELCDAFLGGELDDDPGGLPLVVRHRVIARLQQTHESAVEVLQVAAVLGGAVRPEDLAEVTDRSLGSIVQVLASAERSGVLVSRGDELVFRHELVREALLEELPVALRRTFHREAARVLEGRGAPDGLVARHLIAGAETGDGRTIMHLREIARRSTPLTAVELLASARAICRPGDPQHSWLDVEYGGALVWAGRPLEAESVLRSTLGHAVDASLRYRLAAHLAHALFAVGRPDEAVTLWNESDLSGSAGRPLESGEVALARLFAGDLVGAGRDAATALARSDGSPEVRTVAHTVLAWTEATSGRFTAALRHGRDAVSVAEASGVATALVYGPHLALAVVADGVADNATAQRALEAGTRTIAGHGFTFLEPLAAAAAAIHSYRVGAWDDAVAIARGGLAASDDFDVRLADNWLTAVLACILLDRGDAIAAGEALDRASISGLLGADWVALARSRILAATGRPDAAAMMLSTVLAVATASGSRVALLINGCDAVRDALVAGDREVVGLVSDLRSSVEVESTGIVVPQFEHLDALVSGNADRLEGAARQLAAFGRPLEAASAWSDAALVRAGAFIGHASGMPSAGDLDDARSAAREAVALFTAVGAFGAIDRLRSTLRRHGVRFRVPGRARASTAAGDLTPAEARVAVLVMEGLTNAEVAERLVVSRRTVESHLVRIYAKFGVRSRVALARHVREHPGVITS